MIRNVIKLVQWNVYILIERDKKKQREIAEMIGKTQHVVSKDYRITKTKIEEMREILKEIFS